MMKTILDTGVFTREYEEHSPQLLGYLTRLVNGNEAEGYDLLQEAALRAWKAKAKFKGDSSVKSWFYTIAINLFREKIRRKKLVRFVDEVPETVASGKSPAEECVGKDVRQMIEQEVHKLPQEQLEVFMLIRNDGMSYKDAAEELGTTVGTVRMRLHRANLVLAEKLQQLKDVVL